MSLRIYVWLFSNLFCEALAAYLIVGSIMFNHVNLNLKAS